VIATSFLVVLLAIRDPHLFYLLLPSRFIVGRSCYSRDVVSKKSEG